MSNKQSKYRLVNSQQTVKKTSSYACSLCLDRRTRLMYQNSKRAFYHCLVCDLIFVPQEDHLKPEDEKKIYNFHHNDPHDPKYRAFLNHVAHPLLSYLKPGMEGLDFGSGPGPTLNLMLEEAGFPMKIFDPYYDPDQKNLAQPYDFVTCTEVVEHFNTPSPSWKHLVSLVKPGGILALMTLFHDNTKDFKSWWYKNDLTHVAFYSQKTLRWLAAKFQMRLLYNDQIRAVLFKR